MTTDENERQYQVIDQGLTAHSTLRDVYARRAMLLGNGLLACSITLCAFVFAGDDIFRTIRLDASAARVGLGVASVVVLILTLIETRVNWKGVSTRHAYAAEALSGLKLEFRKSYDETGGVDEKTNARLGTEFDRAQGTLPRIPEKWFVRLKAEHKRKKLLSQRISAYPHAPVWFLRLQLRFEGLQAAWKGREARDGTTKDQNRVDKPNKSSKRLPSDEAGGH